MNIAIIGYGNMGHEIEKAALQRGHAIVERFDINSTLPQAGSDFYKSKKIHCFIDFSHASAVAYNAETASRLHIPLVEGTTGWHDKKEEILDVVKKNNGAMVYGNNFSVGAQMFFRIVRKAAQLMDAFPDYDVGIHETHHTQKKDAPSGTAMTAANSIMSALKRKTAIKKDFQAGVIQQNEIGISSARVGTVFGTHSVLFHSDVDEIEITHKAHSRAGFALGAVLAAELIQGVPGIFSFEELVFEKTFQR